MKTVDTIAGALIAAAVTGLTATLMLLQSPDVQALSDVTPLQWAILGIGFLLSFFKDFQAITTRRLSAKLRGEKDA